VKRSIADLNEVGQQVLVARGGGGGRGNKAFATGRNRSPREREEGRSGSSVRLQLELQTIADVGLVGFPNAGKSTLLSAVSRATPKIAAYPFTTLHPFVGTVEVPGEEHLGTRFTIADIPGLVEGAHRNVGLGHDFLRHIERTKLLLYVIDCSVMAEQDSAGDSLHALREEVALFNALLTDRSSAIVANKLDLACPSRLEDLEACASELEWPLFVVSGLHGNKIQELKHGLHHILSAINEEDGNTTTL